LDGARVVDADADAGARVIEVDSVAACLESTGAFTEGAVEAIAASSAGVVSMAVTVDAWGAKGGMFGLAAPVAAAAAVVVVLSVGASCPFSPPPRIRSASPLAVASIATVVAIDTAEYLVTMRFSAAALR
jgi:hypothetical protein